MVAVRPELLDLFEPHDKQTQFLTAWKRFNLALTGVGFGKSWALTLKCLVAALANTKATTCLAGRTYRDLNDVLVPLLMQHTNRIQERTGVQVIQHWDKLDARIDLLGGGSILLRSYMHIDKIRGLNLGAGFIDEVEWSTADPVEVFGVFNERTRVPCPLHGIHYATSPNGLLGVTRIFYEAQMRRDPDYHVTHGTTLDNPHLSPSFVATLKNSMSKRRWEQEVLGKVLRPAHAVFAEFTDELVIDWRWQDHTHLPWVLAVDWGTNQHHIALMIQVLEDGSWVIADELILDDAPTSTFRDHLTRWVGGDRKWPIAAGVDRARPTENQWLMNWLGQHGCFVRSCDTRHAQYITNGIELMRDQMQPAAGPARLFVARSLVKAPHSTTNGIYQALKSYRYQLDREGRPTAKPYKDDVSDHAVDALRYAYVTTRDDTSLHGGRSLSMIGLGPDGSHPEGKHGKHAAHW